MSEDHKPNRADERQRIEEAGGVVVWAGTWRVGGVLAGGGLALPHSGRSRVQRDCVQGHARVNAWAGLCWPPQHSSVVK